MSATDVELLHRWAEGDNRAGETFYERHVSKVQRFFRNRVARGAEDLVQATFLACLEARSRFRGDAKLTTFLYAVARNKLLEHLRRVQSRDAAIDPLAVSVVDCGLSPASALDQGEREQLVQSAMCRLPIDLQLTLELYYWEGISAREIGEITGVPEGTVRTRLRRAKSQLRERVEAVTGGRGVGELTPGRRLGARR